MLIFSASYNSKIHHFTLQYIHLRIGIIITYFKNQGKQKEYKPEFLFVF